MPRMFSDPNNGNVIKYVPVNMREGTETTALAVTIRPEQSPAILRGRLDAAAAVWARISPSAFQDIAVSPLDLSSHFGSTVNVDFKIVAASPLPGVNRILLTAGISRKAAAAWLN